MFTFSIHLALLIIAGNNASQNQVADFNLSKNQSALIAQKSLSLLAEKKQHSISYFSLEPDMVLSVSTSNSKKLLFVSFNANEGSDGTMRIFNSAHKVAVESNFELIKSPFYATVDISGLRAGDYTVELTTSIGTHIMSLQIK
ncbi:MAG: hypothetical protein NT084_02005 [Bacteroidetes bacterium]|jgi:hypothetical protein|nr:hypothetical protein [Bacteroidota bacterium]